MTPSASAPYTAYVFRALAALVAAAMLSTSGTAAVQHVHGYADHPHDDHHHGLAAHVHAAPVTVRHTDARATEHSATVEACDPGQHAVSVQFVCGVLDPNPVLVAVRVEAVLLASPLAHWSASAPRDVRAHGPPRLTDAPPRAPPVVHPA